MVLPDITVFLGDYINIASHNGIVRPMWMSYSNNSLSVWTAIVDEELLGAAKDYIRGKKLENNFIFKGRFKNNN